MMKKVLRSVGRFLRAIMTEGNPGAGPAGTDRARQESYLNERIMNHW
jgi:hypothetical protein